MLFLLLLPVIAVAGLYLFQDRLIYHTGRYDRNYRHGLPPAVEEIAFSTSQGRQVAFHLPPANDGSRTGRLWVMFGGNGSLALDWLAVLSPQPPSSGDAYLLIEYPGYGLCEGRPGPSQIQENAEAAVRLAVATDGVPGHAPSTRLGIIGFSLGCGAALQFAQKRPADRIVLLAPFTSLSDVIASRMGSPFRYLLRGEYNNRAALDALFGSGHRAQVTVIHGTRDTDVPFSMGRDLAAAHPGIIRFVPIDGAGHNDLLEKAKDEVVRLMR